MTNAVLKALDAAHFMCGATQDQSPLTLALADIIARIEKITPELNALADSGVLIDQEVYGRVKSLFSEVVQPDVIAVYVVVEKLVDQSKLHALDIDIEGHYEILVPSFLSDDLQAGCALDLFHSTVAIKVLDDFSIVVGKCLEAPESYENGTLERLGEYVGITERTLL